MASAVLAAANGYVAALNYVAWTKSREKRDAMATVAWFGSMAYWIVRGMVQA